MSIATRLHKLAELVGDDAGPFHGHAHYVIDGELIETLGRADLQASITAMVQANVARLPYSPILFEYEIGTNVRWFVMLTESGNRLSADVAALYSEKLATVSSDSFIIAVSDQKISISQNAHEADGQAACFATALALLLLNTRGITKEIIEPQRLNKARVASGKKAIPRHTVLRIGTVYARGEPHESTGSAHHRGMPVHLRAAHARDQAYGENWSLRRIIIIPPVLVKGDPDDATAPRTPQRLIRV
jgi:hypothetical protein